MKKWFMMLFLFFCNDVMIVAQDYHTDSLNRKLREILVDDQKYRQMLDTVSLETSRDSYFEIVTKMAEQDRINQEITFPLIDYIERFKLENLADTSYLACYYVIQHSKKDSQLKYANFIDWLHKIGRISNEELMWFKDRLNVRLQRAQLYGVQTLMSATKDIMMYPVAAGYEWRWEMLGEEIPKDHFASYINEYAPIILKENEVAIYGHVCIFNSDGDAEGVSKVSVRFGNSCSVVTNDYGFFCMKFERASVPVTIAFEVDGNKIERRVNIDNDQDFTEVTVYL